ncbi:hypothetical protein VTI74DRAFT_5538 [Chaetomium olivicolor]
MTMAPDEQQNMPTTTLPLSLGHPTVLPTAPYTSRPPSPPYIHVPPAGHVHVQHREENHIVDSDGVNHDEPTAGATFSHHTDFHHPDSHLMTIHPSPRAVHATHLSPEQISVITQDKPQSAHIEVHSSWVYESRRRAQRVLDYLYLGPASAVRDRGFLEREGITMVLCARDARFAAVGAGTGDGMLVACAKRAVEGMGIAVEAVDVVDGRDMVGAFGRAAAKVNAHLLEVGYARQRQQQQGMDQGMDQGKRRGKVLVVCETGNDRSAAIVASYLMTMYGLDTVRAVQFTQLQRFCVMLGDETKYQLQAYWDILRAMGDVGGQEQQPHRAGDGARAHVKRRMDDGGDPDDEMGGMDDGERYAGRNFVPFVERDA